MASSFSSLRNITSTMKQQQFHCRLLQLILFMFVICQLADTTAAIEQTCGGCYCILENKTSVCPSEVRPNYSYSAEWINRLKTLQWTNPLTLSCNPYTDSNCNTNEYPLAKVRPGIEYNCVVDIDSTTYETRTFQGTVQQARSLGLYVTHTGPCGLCSNLHDLSIYIEKSLTLRQLSTICGFAGLLGRNIGINCFRKLVNFTPGCSQIWYYNTLYTRKRCPQCFYYTLTGADLQSSAPFCRLNDCLQCDEKQSGPLFKKFAGRNRRNSGILTDIVRNCSDFRTEIRHNISSTEHRLHQGYEEKHRMKSTSTTWKWRVQANKLLL